MAWMGYRPGNQIRKDGESGRRKLMQYTRYGTVFLAGFQGFGAALAIQNSGGNLVPNPGPQFLFIATVSITTGTMFVMWLGEQITERGIGNGISLLIFAGIVIGLPRGVQQVAGRLTGGDTMAIIGVFGMVVALLLIIAFILFLEASRRKISV